VSGLGREVFDALVPDILFYLVTHTGIPFVWREEKKKKKEKVTRQSPSSAGLSYFRRADGKRVSKRIPFRLA
jgi:hypothetical protein